MTRPLPAGAGGRAVKATDEHQQGNPIMRRRALHARLNRRMLHCLAFGVIASVIATLPAKGYAEGLPLGPVAVPVPAHGMIRGQAAGLTVATPQAPQAPRQLFLQERPAPSLRLPAGARTLPTR